MQLIGVLRSPFVRRVAISLKYYGIPFEHYPLSAFGDDYLTLKAINPVVKLPTLVLDSGDILMDSSLILEYFESQVPLIQKLQPTNPIELALHLRVIGLALMGCDKIAQLVYETKKRPVDKQYQEWIDRVTGQIKEAFTALEEEVAKHSSMLSNSMCQASITTAVAWTFSQHVIPDVLLIKDYPKLAQFVAELEALSIFMDTAIN